MTTPMRTISFKLSERLDDALTELARRRKSSRSALLREAVEALATPRVSQSVTAAVDALGVAVDGPADLSTARRHLRGYGE